MLHAFVNAKYISVTSSAHVADIGKVLAGIQVPPADTDEFSEYLTMLGYPYVEETDNEVYKRFLRG